jgi:hypothetical protein
VLPFDDREVTAEALRRRASDDARADARAHAEAEDE